MGKNPIKLSELWFKVELENNIIKPNAMTLATADIEGKPSARIVLLKNLNQS